MVYSLTMAVPAEQKAFNRRAFAGAINGPRIIRLIDDRVLNGDSYDTPCIKDAVLTPEDYQISKKQKYLFDDVHWWFVQHQEATKFAQRAHAEDPENFAKNVAPQIGCQPEEIIAVTFHPISTTFSLTPEAFARVTEENRKRYEEDRRERDPAGWTRASLFYYVQNQSVPYSVVNPKTGRKSDPDHEYFHVLYRYLHDQIRYDPNFSTRMYREELQAQTQEMVEEGNTKDFREMIKKLADFTLHCYLDERCSYALTETMSLKSRPEVINVYEKFFGKENRYNITFNKHIAAIRAKFPKTLRDRLPWEIILFDETEKARRKALYIETRYRRLQPKKTPKEIIAILQFLTPDQGFLINTFLQDTPPTLTQMMAWKREYENPTTTDEYMDDFANFLVRMADPDPEKYMFLLKQAKTTYGPRPIAIHEDRQQQEENLRTSDVCRKKII